MARVVYNSDNDEVQEAEQGDLVYFEPAVGGVGSFWGIYCQIGLECVVSLDGGGDRYVHNVDRLYLGGLYSKWRLTKIIPCDDAIITISEKDREVL